MCVPAKHACAARERVCERDGTYITHGFGLEVASVPRVRKAVAQRFRLIMALTSMSRSDAAEKGRYTETGGQGRSRFYECSSLIKYLLILKKRGRSCARVAEM